jgi:hypothetical protein
MSEKSHLTSRRKPSSSSSSSSRRCDYGEAHVSRDKYEEYKEEARARGISLAELQTLVTEKDDELLKYHNELAEETTRLDEAREEAKRLREELRKAEDLEKKHRKEYNQLIDEHDERVEERDAFEKQLQQLKDENKNLKRPRETSEAIDPAEFKRLKTESIDLRQRLATAETNKTKLLSLQAELDRHKKIDAAFTPEPEDPVLAEINKILTKPAADPISGLVLIKKDLEDTAREEARQRGKLLKAEERNQVLEERQQRELGEVKYELDVWRELAHSWEAETPKDVDQALKLYVRQGDLRSWKDLVEKRGEKPAHTRENLEKQLERLTDLSPFRNLHPSLEKLPTAGPTILSKALQEVLTWELSTIWNNLPHEASQDLVTPTSQLSELLERIRTAVEKQAQSPLIKNLQKDLRDAKRLLDQEGPVLEFLRKILIKIVHNE